MRRGGDCPRVQHGGGGLRALEEVGLAALVSSCRAQKQVLAELGSDCAERGRAADPQPAQDLPIDGDE